MQKSDTECLCEAYDRIFTENLGKKLATAATIGAMGYAALKGGQAVKHAADEYTAGMPSREVPAEGSSRKAIVDYFERINIGKPLDKKHIDFLHQLISGNADEDLKTRAKYLLDQQERISADEAKIAK